MTVTPIVDYEPGYGLNAAGPTSARPPAALRRHLHAVPPTPPSSRCRDAAAFADAALRSVLEVIDRRRPLAQLRPMLDTGLIDSVSVFAHAVPARHSGAVLRRVRLQSADPDEHAFEVFASYTRGPRLHAVACRVEWLIAVQGAAWRMVALHIG